MWLEGRRCDVDCIDRFVAAVRVGGAEVPFSSRRESLCALTETKDRAYGAEAYERTM